MHSGFVERTGMNVNIAEFDAIIEVYNNSDVNNDDFCKLWVKMNFNLNVCSINKKPTTLKSSGRIKLKEKPITYDYF